ncbi:sensor histidine kinase [Propionibacteriaceae bacterium Y2011]
MAPTSETVPGRVGPGHWRRLVPDWPWRDIAGAAAILLIGVVLIAAGIGGTGTGLDLWGIADLSPWWQLACLVPACVLVAVKRYGSVKALLAGIVLFAVDVLVLGDGGIAMILVLFDLLFGVGLYAGRRARDVVTTGVIMVTVALAVLVSVLAQDLRQGILVALQLVAIGVVPLWWAGNIRQQRELSGIAVDRARDDAIHAERAAIARDLHDVVAARLSTTALHSGAALALPADHDRDRKALRAVRESSVAALDEMRDMITVLRQGQDPEPPATARLADIAVLVEELRSAGVPVELETDVPDDLSPLIEHSAHRIVQEALTNVRRHAGTGPVRVMINNDDERLLIEVTSTLPAPGRRTPEPGTGTGLWSMAERARAVGGTLDAGPDGSRWVVRAVLPRGGRRHGQGATSEQYDDVVPSGGAS